MKRCRNCGQRWHNIHQYNLAAKIAMFVEFFYLYAKMLINLKRQQNQSLRTQEKNVNQIKTSPEKIKTRSQLNT